LDGTPTYETPVACLSPSKRRLHPAGTSSNGGCPSFCLRDAPESIRTCTGLVLVWAFDTSAIRLGTIMELMTPQETADFLRISVPALRELTRHRTQVRSRAPLPCLRLHKKAIRFDRAAVEKWLSDLSTTAKRGELWTNHFTNN
jgi:hypothetical protein